VPIQVESSNSEGAIVLRVRGRLDAETATDFETILGESLAPGPNSVVLDFSGLDYIGSAGLSSVLTAGKIVEAQGGRLVLCGLTGRIKQIFSLCGLDALFPMFDSRDAALMECRNRAAHN
jgi:anti-sigma B factor antagonist